MQANTNTDMVGGLAVLAVSAFFYSQISEDFTQFGVFFPKLILPCLVLLGVILLVRGLARRTKKKTIFRINRTMALVMIVGALWAVIMNYLGFIVGSSLALSIIVLAYIPAGNVLRPAFSPICRAFSASSSPSTMALRGFWMFCFLWGTSWKPLWWAKIVKFLNSNRMKT